MIGALEGAVILTGCLVHEGRGGRKDSRWRKQSVQTPSGRELEEGFWEGCVEVWSDKACAQACRRWERQEGSMLSGPQG